MKITRLLAASVVGVVGGAMLPLATMLPAQAAPPVTVVTGGDISANGSSGWAIETTNGATGAFVKGTGTPPLGSGSFFMKSNATGDKKFLHLTKLDGVPFAGRPLADLTELSFSSYAANGVYSPYVNIPIHSDLIDANNNGLADGTEVGVPSATGNAILVHEPTVPGSVWTTSNTIDAGATWRITRPVVSGGVIPVWTYRTYADWMSILTDGVFNPDYGDIQWVIGDSSSAAWSGKSGWVDAITVTTTSEAASFDLEEGLGSCPVAIDTPNKSFTLIDDCTTDSTLMLRDGWSLDGAGYTITAVDPSASVDFTGAVVTNEIVSGGGSMNITDVTIDGDLADGCSNNLFGVKFDGASGTLTDSTISDIKYGAGSGCQGGNSVDITNLGGSTRLTVDVDNVDVTGMQKTGIRANGKVALTLTNSSVASSELDLVTASNSLQISRGARAYVSRNTFGGNDWDGNTTWSASGVLLYGAEDVTFTRNVVTGTDTDLGLYISQDATYQAGRTTLTCNLVERDAAVDTPFDLWSTGIGADADLTAKVDARGNTVRGFATAYENVDNETGGPCALGPVLDLRLSGSSSSVTADWSAPAPVDAAPVESYEVTLTPGGATQTVTDTFVTFAGLNAAKEYTASVVPLNAAGRGAAASASGTTDPGPATVTEVSATASTATVGWSAPGNAYTGFDLVIEDGGGVVDSQTANGDARTWTFTGLDAETNYSITVTPWIGAKSGASDTDSVMTKQASAPGPVSGLSLEGSGTTLTATWTAAPGASDYEATVTPGGQVVAGTGTAANFTIVPGKEYTATVVAHNDVGWGPGRSASFDTSLPDAPGQLSAKGGTTAAKLTWNPVSTPSPVTDYSIVASPTSGQVVTKDVTRAGLAFPVKVTGLARKMSYTFAVTAENAFGTSQASSVKLRGTVAKAKFFSTKVTAGKKLTVKGKVTDADNHKPVSGQKLVLFAKTKGTSEFVNLGVKATSAGNGKYTFTYKPKSTATYYVLSRGSVRMNGRSAKSSVTVKASVTMKASRSSMKKGQEVTFSGKAKPTTATAVDLQRKQGSGWVTQKSKALADDGTYSVKWKADSGKDYGWRVRVAGPTIKSGVSASKLIAVN